MTGERLAQMIVDLERLQNEAAQSWGATYLDVLNKIIQVQKDTRSAARLLLALDDPEPTLGHDAGD